MIVHMLLPVLINYIQSLPNIEPDHFWTLDLNMSFIN